MDGQTGGGRNHGPIFGGVRKQGWLKRVARNAGLPAFFCPRLRIRVFSRRSGGDSNSPQFNC